MRKIVEDAAGTPKAEPAAQGVTLSIPTHMAAPSHALVLREGPKPTRPRGRIPRVARLASQWWTYALSASSRSREWSADPAPIWARRHLRGRWLSVRFLDSCKVSRATE